MNLQSAFLHVELNSVMYTKDYKCPEAIRQELTVPHSRYPSTQYFDWSQSESSAPSLSLSLSLQISLFILPSYSFMCMQTLSQTTVLCTHGSAMMHKYIYPQVRSKSDLSSSMWFCTPVQLINILTKSLKLRDYKLPAKGFGDENNIFCHRSENKCIEFKNNPLTHQPMQITQHHIDPPTHTQTSSELLRCISALEKLSFLTKMQP